LCGIKPPFVDFHCPKAKLVIELDGGQHYSSEGKEKGRVRVFKKEKRRRKGGTATVN